MPEQHKNILDISNCGVLNTILIPLKAEIDCNQNESNKAFANDFASEPLINIDMDKTIKNEDDNNYLHADENSDSFSISNLLEFDSGQLLQLTSSDDQLMDLDSEDLRLSNLSITS